MKLYDSKAAKEHAEKMVKELDIRCTGIKQSAGSLSGGNQQKVCLAKALTLNPNVLFVSEPTRGIDIGAKKLVLETLAKLNQETGMTVVMVSSELVELRSVCDRIAIVSEGKIASILSRTHPMSNLVWRCRVLKRKEEINVENAKNFINKFGLPRIIITLFLLISRGSCRWFPDESAAAFK